MNAKKNFGGWVAVVTGGAGGLGRAISKRLIERGIKCVLVDIHEHNLALACRDLGPLAVPYVADLTDRAAIDRLVYWLQEAHGRTDILINNAAITDTTLFEARSVDSIVNEMNINLISPLVVTRSLMPLLRKAGDGRIVSIVSLGGIFPLPETSIYSASKFGLRGAMLCLGLDGERLGLKVSIVNPSATETPMLMREAIEGGNTLQFADPPQQPSEVAEQVMRTIDDPKLERYVRQSESWTVRLAMLLPNVLSRAIPLFRKKGEVGHRKYVESLKKRGLIFEKNGQWHLTPRQ